MFAIIGVFALGSSLSHDDREAWDFSELARLYVGNGPAPAVLPDGPGYEGASTTVLSAGQEASAAQEAAKPARFILHDVPFTSQAPFAEWADKRQQDGCEEASVLMAVKWARGEALDKKTAKDEILAMADYQEKEYGSYVDTSAEDTVKRLVKGYYNHANAAVAKDVSAAGIIAELDKGNLVLAPCQGQRLGNPNFTSPGPERHMLVIRGHDPKTDEFITNDPGTRLGQGYRYKTGVLLRAILDYPTGDHEPIIKEEKNVIVFSR